MAASSSFSYQYVTEKIIIHVGFIILFAGVVGNALNIIVFTSLKTFRETSCAFYLTVASFANIIHLLASLLSRVLITGYNIDLTLTSSAVCKLRQFIAILAPTMALSSMCFATMDQFASLTVRWRKWSQRWIAHRLILVTFVFWFLCNIPVIVFNNTTSSNNGRRACSITNPDFNLFYSRFYVSYLLGFLQILIRSSLGLLAFINVRRLVPLRVPIIRLERDKQITSMVLIEVVIDVLISLPFFIYYTYSLYASFDSPQQASLYPLLILTMSTVNYGTYAVGFYIYCCASSRFRKQLVYVLVGIHMKYWCRTETAANRNQIVPQPDRDQPVVSIIDGIVLQQQHESSR